MTQTALVTGRTAADAATADAAANPIALARAAALPRREDAGGVALFRPRGAVWNAAAGRHRLPIAWICFLLVVIVPVAIAAAYYFLVAADQYVAEFRFGLRSAEPIRTDPGALLQQGTAPLQIGLDSYAVVQYIGSRAIVDDLGKTLDLRRMFSTPAADWPARLHLPVPIEELVFYWRGQVDAFFDATNGTITVRARAFSAPDALALAQGILASSEHLVNGLSERARRDSLRQSEGEVQKAERRLTAALARLRDYRDKQGLIDPHKAADANAALAGRLRDELVRAGTDLSTLKEYMRDDAPALKILEARIETLRAQQSAVEGEATDTETTRSQALSRMMGSFEELEGERHFAETAYQHALEALDRARIDAARQQIYIADFVRPSLPEQALYPRRLRSLGIVFVVAFAAWAIGSLAVRSVRDHLL
jgi:capsular polysaccharide transport system permease protein